MSVTCYSKYLQQQYKTRKFVYSNINSKYYHIVVLTPVTATRIAVTLL